MPHFTAIAVDSLHSGDSKSVVKSDPISSSILNPKCLRNSLLKRRNSTSITECKVQHPLKKRNSIYSTERKVKHPQVPQAPYVTPKVTPIPDSLSLFCPPPFIVNHKRGGPRLLESSLNEDVSCQRKSIGEQKVKTTTNAFETIAVNSSENISVSFIVPDSTVKEHQDGINNYEKGSSNEGFGDSNRKLESNQVQYGFSESNGRNYKLANNLATENDSPQCLEVIPERDTEAEDLFDLQESVSVMSITEGEDNCGERSLKFITPRREFFYACEELSPESGSQPCLPDLDAGLRDIRLSLLSEIELRKKEEEILINMRSQWQGIRNRLSPLGLTLPVDPTISEGDQPEVDPAEEVCRQVYVARFVADSIGRGIARAEVEMEMEAQIETKNFEIARLLDRLHYYEGLNWEMTQRNREAADMAWFQSQKRRRRQRWIWSTVATAISVGSAALAWSYLPTEKGSLTSFESQEAHEPVS